MADDKFEPREINFRQWLPWTQIFRGFWVALDHKKLLLAAAGILVMSLGWWVISSAAYKLRTAPDWGSGNYSNWDEFKKERARWNVFYKTAGPGDDKYAHYDANDLATSPQEFDNLSRAFALIQQEAEKSPNEPVAEIREKTLKGLLSPEVLAAYQLNRFEKPSGQLRTLPWFEDRGPNQFMLVTGNLGQPWSQGHLIDWFVRDQVPVLLEPLVKLFRPVRYFLDPNAGFKEQFYFLLVMIWTVATWAIFGGAITRIAAVEIARNEKIGLGEALRFTLSRWKSYVFASFFPLLIIAFIVLLLALFGLVNWIPILAEFWNGLLWFLVLLGGLTIAVLLVGLVGWPMIHSTLSAEGSDSFDALSRSYSYVLQKPWSYLWYVAVALVYGAVVVFFVGFMGSLTVYLGKWGISQFTSSNYYSDPSHMFIYAPTSYHWRDLLLQGSQVDVNSDRFRGWFYIGAFLVSVWLYLVFLLIVGYGYSYFWSASTMIYLLMRRKVDDTEMDEVYLEEEDSDEPYSTTPAAAPAAPAGGAAPIQLVEPPTLRQPASPVTTGSPSASGESTAPKQGDGEAAPGGAPS